MSVDFPTPAQATIVTTLTSLFAHASSRYAISSSRPKSSLPVTGNLATEIFFGPCLPNCLRVLACEVREGSGAAEALRHAGIVAAVSSVGDLTTYAGAFAATGAATKSSLVNATSPESRDAQNDPSDTGSAQSRAMEPIRMFATTRSYSPAVSPER